MRQGEPDRRRFEVALGSFDAVPGKPFAYPSRGIVFGFLKPLRPLADRFSARLLKSELSPDNFQTECDRCLLHGGLRGVVYRAWERLHAGSIAWRGESLSWRRLIRLQARELAHWLGGTTAAPRF